MHKINTSIAALLLLVLAISLQNDEVRNMAAYRAQQLLRRSAPILRGVLPYMNLLPTFLFPTTTKTYSPPPPPPQQQQPHHHFTTTTAIMADANAFMNAMESRRTIYQLTNESTIPDARIKELIEHTIKHVPTSFNSQTTRVVVVLKEEHEKLWDAIMAVYEQQLAPEKFEHAKGRMVGFRKAYGTVSGMLARIFCWRCRIERDY